MKLYRALLASFFAVLLLIPPAASVAQERRDHERARAALEAGQIRPLSDLLAEVERRFRGRVIEADLERDDTQWLYELKILPPNGRVFIVELDAATGALVRSRGPVQERAVGEAQPRPPMR
ncbi:PepSY domain-containing protein [Sediminicoccus sp. KRV36]|uniref:PepSY domain-containing protein n=1 Tax=Sediminicoccus sp. KRV36 TaxID=3133721 RepID=UPI002010737A|nr:PepSY domain-containing protein [Sediminicoccus rosea]UPY36631.1 PepSY domain-containing protein [Sediminicoccus rosea]